MFRSLISFQSCDTKTCDIYMLNIFCIKSTGQKIERMKLITIYKLFLIDLIEEKKN